MREKIEEKKSMLLANHIAVWDVIDSCDIIGSSDSSIKNVVPADIAGLLPKTNISRILLNGKLAGKLYKKYSQGIIELPAAVLPSTVFFTLLMGITGSFIFFTYRLAFFRQFIRKETAHRREPSLFFAPF